MKCPKCGRKMRYIESDNDSAMGGGFHIDGWYWCKCGYTQL